MKTSSIAQWMVPGIVLMLAMLACGLGGAAAPAQANLPIGAIQIGADLTQIDVCKAIPQPDIEAAMGRSLSAAPQAFQYYDTAGTAGCYYDAGKDSSGEAHFGYVVLVPLSVYNNQPLYQNTSVSGLGQDAYFNNGADARQLWVKVNDQVAFVVAFGDVPREPQTQAIAKLMLAAIH